MPLPAALSDITVSLDGARQGSSAKKCSVKEKIKIKGVMQELLLKLHKIGKVTLGSGEDVPAGEGRGPHEGLLVNRLRTHCHIFICLSFLFLSFIFFFS